MRYIVIILLCIMAMTACSQVKLTQIEKSATKWHIPIAKRVIPGQTGFFQTYMSLPQLIDSIAWSPFTLTTVGNSGAATFNTSTKVLNIPNYTLAGLGGVNTRLQVDGIYYSGDLTLGTRNITTYPEWNYSGGTIYFDLPAGSNGQVLKHNGVGWTAGTDNNTGMTSWNFSVNSGAAYTMGNGFNMDFQNGTGISWSRSGQYLTATNTLPFNYIGVQANAGAVGTLTNTATLNLTGSGATTVSRSGNTFTISSSAGSQNLSFSPESFGDIYQDISGGVGVNFRQGTAIDLVRTASNVLTVNNTGVTSLSAGSGISLSGSTGAVTVTATGGLSGGQSPRLAYWTGSNTLSNTAGMNWDAATSRLGLGYIGTPPQTLSVSGTMNVSTMTGTPNKVIGTNSSGDVGQVSVGSGLSLSSGTLSATDASTTNELQTISTSGAAGNITLSNGGGTLNLNVNDADASTSNELQTLSFNGTTNNLTISSGNTVDVTNYREFGASIGSIALSNTSETSYDITGSIGTSVNTTVNTTSNIITITKGSNYEYTLSGYVYNESSTETGVLINFYRTSTLTDWTYVTVPAGGFSSFSFTGMSNDGYKNFNAKAQAQNSFSGGLIYINQLKMVVKSIN